MKLANEVARIDWNAHNANTRYSAHGIHRYSGKFIPQVAAEAIRLVSQAGDLVLDPFCGSGTTLLECARAHRRSVGIDLNPLAILISTVKTAPVSVSSLESFVSSLEMVLRQRLE